MTEKRLEFICGRKYKLLKYKYSVQSNLLHTHVSIYYINVSIYYIFQLIGMDLKYDIKCFKKVSIFN